MTAIGSTFRNDQPFLRELLQEVNKGTIQLPDFQRGWVWDDHRIRALLASVSLSYPIGAVMLMETAGDGASFAPRLVEGSTLTGKPPHPEKLILDGQQRVTSLYLALASGHAVATQTEKKEPIQRWYYLDMQRCLDPEFDRVDAIVGVPADRVIRRDFNRVIELDLSTPKGEYEAQCFPLRLIFDDANASEWFIGYQECHQYAPERMRFLNRFQQEIRQRFLQYKVPVIELLKDTPKDAVCQVFENVNTGGVGLTVFELVTATFAAEDYRLRPDWEERRKRFAGLDVLTGVNETDFLQAVTLLATYRRNQKNEGAVGAKRRDMLRLKLDDYKVYADLVGDGFRDAAQLLLREKVFADRNLPYQSQLVPLATICAILGRDFEPDQVKRKLARWYWCGVFGELYGGATEARFALDVQQVPPWVVGGQEPRTVADASFAPTRLLTMQSRQSAAYKGMMALLTRLGSLDLRTGDALELSTYMDDGIDIHHIFPAHHCERQRYERDSGIVSSTRPRLLRAATGLSGATPRAATSPSSISSFRRAGSMRSWRPMPSAPRRFAQMIFTRSCVSALPACSI